MKDVRITQLVFFADNITVLEVMMSHCETFLSIACQFGIYYLCCRLTDLESSDMRNS